MQSELNLWVFALKDSIKIRHCSGGEWGIVFCCQKYDFKLDPLEIPNEENIFIFWISTYRRNVSI